MYRKIPALEQLQRVNKEFTRFRKLVSAEFLADTGFAGVVLRVQRGLDKLPEALQDAVTRGGTPE
ncbi:MAG: hypothetical protein KGI71_06665 [Patescibacteria group bacterium]|nr:hypothetical protein [Patescibacteria group bacterium]